MPVPRLEREMTEDFGVELIRRLPASRLADGGPTCPVASGEECLASVPVFAVIAVEA